MREITTKALERASALGASYADIRVIDERRESIRVKNGNVDNLSSSMSRGLGVRALYDGAWGFASSSQVDNQEVMAVAERALAIARASARVKRQRDVELAPVQPVQATWKTNLEVDPFDVKLEDRMELLLDADRLMRQQPGIRIASASMSLFRENKVFASTEGSYIQQERTEVGAGIDATASSGLEFQRRSYPSSFGGDYACAGYEFITGLDLAGHAEAVAREAVALLSAEQCPSGTKDLVLESSQLALQIHESCGHPIELDRVLGQEASFAGTSFLTPEKLGDFQYGSDVVNITADATIPGALGSFGYDDDGVPGQRVTIIDQGKFVNYLTSRETGGELGMAANGTNRADGFNRIPIVRMTNINLEPGDWTLDDIIKDTKDGVLMKTNKSWSIDDKRLNFQFGTEAAYEIKDGSLGKLYKNPTYTGITPEFWGSCDAVAGPAEWRVWGLPNCGKGEPSQTAHVGHGAAPTRFRNVKVGVGKW
ncbi:MAG: TldD/PmbA family protein [Bacillota bacterium]